MSCYYRNHNLRASALIETCFCVYSPTGSVVAILGAEKNDGKFTVEDYCLADLPPQTPREPLNADRCVYYLYTE